MKYLIRSLGFVIDVLVWLVYPIGIRITYHIFCFPPKPKLLPNQQLYLDKARIPNIEYQGQSIALYKWGHGPKIIFCCHGWRSNAFRWKKFIDTFSHEKFTIYALDAPAQGASSGFTSNVPIYAKAIEMVIKHIGVPYAILGHSFGCMSTLYMLHRNKPLWPSKLVFLASAGSAKDFVDFYQRTLSLSTHTIQKLEAFFIKKYGHPIAFFSVSNLVKQPMPQGLIVHDIGDKDVRVAYAHEMHSLWPNSKLCITEGYGHALKHISVVNKVIDFVGV